MLLAAQRSFVDVARSTLLPANRADADEWRVRLATERVAERTRPLQSLAGVTCVDGLAHATVVRWFPAHGLVVGDRIRSVRESL